MRSAIWLAFASGLVGMAYRTGFGVLYPGMVADQGWSVGEITGAFSLAMLLYSPAAVLAGELADSRGVRVTMLFGTTLLAGGLALVAVADDIWQMYLLYGLAVGPGTAAVGYVPMIKLLSLRAGRRLGLAIGLFNVGQGVGAWSAAHCCRSSRTRAAGGQASSRWAPPCCW